MADEGLGLVEHGFVQVAQGRVVAVGEEKSGGDFDGFEVVDCQGCVVMPGFVDPHTHLIFGGWRAEEFELRLAGRTYKEIAAMGGGILSTVKATRALGEEELYHRARGFLEEMLSWGTTTVEVKSGYGLDTATELKTLRVARRLGEAGLATVVPTFLGAHAVPPDRRKDEYIEELKEVMLPEVARLGLARFCDVFCENFVFNAAESRDILEAGKRCGLLPVIHADEIESSGGAEVAAAVGAVAASHLLKPSESGLKLMAERGVIAVLLPGTCFFLQEKDKPPVARMRELGMTIALGSDFNPGSSTLLAQPLTAQFGCTYYGLTIVEALRGITINAARALRLPAGAGTLTPGAPADIVVTDLVDYRHLIYRLGHNPVRLVFRQGRLGYKKGQEVKPCIT